MSIKVSVVEDKESIRLGLVELLDSTPGFRAGPACASAEQALQVLSAQPPQVVLMDINLPGLSGIECVRQLKRVLPDTQFIMLTIEEESERVFEALRAGASGYLVKNVDPEKLLASIAEVHRGGSPMSSQIARILVRSFHEERDHPSEAENLTPREQQILDLLARGYRSKEAAEELGISVQTVLTHIRNIYEKLQVRSRAEAVARYLRR
jgi:DNA-binding NarL/FixJ family response regulator